jgi:hypothetical protein
MVGLLDGKELELGRLLKIAVLVDSLNGRFY